nr:RDD family protein [Tissierella sp.]
MIGRRMIAHTLNRIIIAIPALILVWTISKLIFPNYFILATDESGLVILWLYKYLIFLPAVFLDLIVLGHKYMSAIEIIQIILPTLMSMILIDIMIITLLKGDIGMKIMGLKIISIKDKPLSSRQIIIRTVIKYFSLSFTPFLLVYIFFNKERISLHDKISATKVVKIQK